MDTKLFVSQLNQITNALLTMTPAQREVVHQSIQGSQGEISVNELFQPIFDNLSQCPHCYSPHFKKWGRVGETQRYYCKDCHKTFNNKTKTPLAKLHKCHIWEEYARCMELKLTLREAASICNINLKTAFLWRHRFLTAQSEKYPDKLSGIIEVDEFFLANSVLCSDGAWAYVNVAKTKSCDHKRLISRRNRVIDKIYHIQTVNGAIAHFKGWVDVKMRGVATKYLSHYLAWFRESRSNHNSRQILQSAYGGQQ